MEVRYLVVPYALTDVEPRVLLTKVQLIQTRVRSKKIRGQIPKHAGQWTLVEGAASSSTSAEGAACALFRERTGIDLADPDITDRYSLSEPKIEKLQDAKYTPLTVYYIRATPEGLDALAGQVEANLDEPSRLVDGVYSDAQVVRLSQALVQIGPIAAPQDGWSAFILRNYYGAQAPGALDTVYPTLVQQIAKRSRASGDLYRVALQNLPGGARPVVPRLVGLEVENAEIVDAGKSLYAANYHPGAVVTIRAIVEPKNAASSIKWEGGEPDPSGRADSRVVSLGQVSKLEHPIAVSATLGTSNRGMSLIIRPLLHRFEVANAERSPDVGPSGGIWVAEYSEDEAPIRIAITTTPDTKEAHEHLQWTGGAPDPEGRRNCRIVPRNRLTGAEDPVRVRAAVNPWWDFILYVLPRLSQLDVVAGPGVYNLGGGNYAVDYHPAGTYTIRATTFPDIPLAYQVVSWSTGAPPGQQIQVNRSPIDNPGMPTPYSVRVQRQGVTLRSLTINVLVQPTITSIDFSGYAFDDGGGSWHSYAVAGLFNLPAALAMLVTAQTAPNTPQAWAHLAWQNTSGAGPTLADQLIALNVPRAIQVGARVGQAPPQQLTLDIRAPQLWPPSGLQLAVNQITFDGPGGRQVVDDDPANVGIPFNQDWVAGIAHNLQSPLTYTRNTNVNESAVIGIVAPNVPVNVTIRATAFVPRHNNPLYPMAWSWPGNAVAAAPPPTMALGNIAANVLLPNEVVHADPMFMFWEFREVGGSWVLFDVTSHMLYVTLGNPVAYTLRAAVPPVAAVPYFTLLAISCREANGDNAAGAVVGHIFGAFTALNAGNGANVSVRRKRPLPGTLLTYWNPALGAGQDLQTMLANVQDSGTCRAWAEAFICMGALHGIATLNNVIVVPNTLTVSPIANEFLVRNWTFHAPPAAAGNAYTHAYAPGGPPVAGNATWGLGLVGQNSANPPPSFGNHFIVRDTATGILYDPSYGSGPHAAWPGWTAAAVGGLRTYAPPVPPNSTGFAPAGVPPPAGPLVKLYDQVTNVFLN